MPEPHYCCRSGFRCTRERKKERSAPRGMKLPGCLDLLTNDVVFPARKTLFPTLISVVNGSPRDHSIT